jgi:uncharacterized protein YkwD
LYYKLINMKKIITLLLVILTTNLSISQNSVKIFTKEEYEQHKKTRILEIKLEDSLKNNFNGKKYIDSVLIFLNQYRKENNCNNLELSENLCNVAELQSQYCADRLIVTHEQDNEFLDTPFHRGFIYGEKEVSGEIVSETSISGIIFRKRTIPSAPIENFKRSSAHSSIMKMKNFKRCGISVVQSKLDKNKYYTVIVFSE